MNTIQITNPLCPQAFLNPKIRVQGIRRLPPPVSLAFAPGPLRNPPLRNPPSIKLTTSRQQCPHLMLVCASHGEARSGNGNQDPLWKSFGKAMENLGKKTSVEDLLRQQIEKGEFYDGSGDGGTPPGGGGGGGDGFGESNDEGFFGLLDEIIQVILATLGLIFVYAYIINGAEMTRLAKDYIKFRLGGQKSVRLTRFLNRWERFRQRQAKKKNKEVDRFWLEKEIIRTPTWWDHPEKYRRLFKADLQPQMEQQERQQPESGYSESGYSDYDDDDE